MKVRVRMVVKMMDHRSWIYQKLFFFLLLLLAILFWVEKCFSAAKTQCLSKLKGLKENEPNQKLN